MKLLADAVEAPIAPDERRREFRRRTSATARAYEAVLPDERTAPFLKQVAKLHIVAEAVRAKLSPVGISALVGRIEALLDAEVEDVEIAASIIEGDERGDQIGLTDIDFDKLAKLFQTKLRTSSEQAQSQAQAQAQRMAQADPTR